MPLRRLASAAAEDDRKASTLRTASGRVEAVHSAAEKVVTISQPGSYYLTRNLTVSSGDGINITTIGVTLDLNGFTIRSTRARQIERVEVRVLENAAE